MKILTVIEKKAITRLKKAFDMLPNTLRVYVVDSSVFVCKLGVPSSDICERVGDGAFATNMLEDVHDDMDCGR